MNTNAAHDAEGERFSRLWHFFEMVANLNCDRISHVKLLVALAEDLYANPDSKGLTVATLAHRVALPLEAARHGIRVLRSDGMVRRASRSGRVEFFQLTQDAQGAVATCVSVFALEESTDTSSAPLGGRRARA